MSDIPQILDTSDIYFHDISRWGPLSSEREQELAKRIQSGDLSAEWELIQANLRFVVRVARAYSNQGVDLRDLISEGNIGLIQAARRFSAEKNYRFISYAVWWIRQAMLQALSNQSRMMRIPLNRSADFYKYRKACIKLEQQYHRVPSLSEISLETGFSEEETKEIQSWMLPPVSMDKTFDGEKDSESLSTSLRDPGRHFSEDIENISIGMHIQELLDILQGRKKDIIMKYYGIGVEHPMTLSEIGDSIGLTRERVRQLRDAALRELKASYRFKEFIQENYS